MDYNGNLSSKYTYVCHQSGLQWCPRRCFVGQGGPSSQASCSRIGDGCRLSDRSFQWFVTIPQGEDLKENLGASLSLLQTEYKLYLFCCREETTDLHHTENEFLLQKRAWRCCSSLKAPLPVLSQELSGSVAHPSALSTAPVSQ